MIRCYLVVVITAGLVLAALPAGADDKAESKKHFNAGLAAMKSEDFDSAAKELETSVALMPRKSNLLNLATCYQALGRTIEALERFERVRDEFGAELKKSEQKEVDAQIAELKGAIANLTLTVSPQGAEVKLNGTKLESSKLSAGMRLMPGAHDIEATLEGYDTATQKVDLSAGAEQTVTIELKEAKANLTIVSNAEDAEVLVNGEPMGKTPLDAPLALEKGEYVVTVQKDGFETKVQNVTLKPAGEETLDVQLAPVPAVADLPPQQDTTSAAAAEPTDKKPFPLFPISLAGTIVTAGVAAGMWGAAIAKMNEHNDKNDQLDPNDWKEQLESQRDAAQDDSEKYNKIAVVMTAVTGAFVALTVTSAVLRAKQKKEAASDVALTPGGVEVRF